MILPVDKPAGWTSFDVVNKLRMVSRVKKVGHAGTLDPFATGLLLICFARATKQVAHLMELEKEYVGTFQLGAETDTHDLTGKVTARYEVPPITLSELETAISRYRGEIEQVPPMFSALKHRGRRLYELARKGEVIEREPRKVTIYAFDVLSFDGSEIQFRIVCSRGTYIRAIARDLGQDLGCGAYLKSLVRTRIGDFQLERAWNLENLVKEIKRQRQRSV